MNHNVRLSFSNFTHYINTPLSPQLDQRDHLKALICTLALGILTLGSLQFICWVTSKLRNRVSLKSTPKTINIHQLGQNILIKRPQIKSIFDKLKVPSNHKMRSFFFNDQFKENFRALYLKDLNQFDFGFENELFGVPLTFKNQQTFHLITKKYPQALAKALKHQEGTNPFNPANGNHYCRLANNNIASMFKLCADEADPKLRMQIYDMVAEILAEAIILKSQGK